MTLVVKRCNPVDDLRNDEEIIEYLCDCYRDHPLTFKRACMFIEESVRKDDAPRLIEQAIKACEQKNKSE